MTFAPFIEGLANASDVIPEAGDVFVRTYRGLEGKHDLPTHDVILVTRADPDGVVVWQELNFYTHALPKFITLRDVPGRMLRDLTGLNGIPLSRTAEGTPGDWYDALADYYEALSDYAERIFADNDIGPNGHRRGEE